MKLTDKLIDTLPVPAQGNRRVPDSEVRGFNAQITASGERGFVLRYRVHGRERLYTIGARSAWTTVSARNRARELRRLIDQGVDPHEHETRARDEAMTVAEFWERVYRPLHFPALRPRTQRNLKSMMARDVLPKLGRLPVRDVDRADIAALHREITKRARVRANRVRTALSSFFAWAEQPHILDNGDRILPLRELGSNPTRGVTLNQEGRRQRFLSPAEIARLIDVLDRRTAPQEQSSAALIRFLLLTGCRFGEAAHATWDQFDLAAGTWTKPSSHTKQKREHATPLSAPALALLDQIHATSTNDLVFPGRFGRPLTKVSSFWRSVSRQAGLEGVRVHDLRHSFASLLASGGASLLLIGTLLGHTQQSTTARYAHLVDSVQREAVERAGAVITGQPSAEVVKLKSRSG